MAYLYIDREECIGDSLGKINKNAQDFDNRINAIYSNFRQTIPTQYVYINATTANSAWRGTAVSAGNDTGADGTVARPFRTLKAGLQFLYSRDCKNQRIEIRLCPGTYQGVSIAGMPPGAGPAIESPIESPIGSGVAISILGNSQNDTFITQFKRNNAHWHHLVFWQSAYYYVENVCFRYNPSVDPFVPTAGPGTGTTSNYDVIWIDRQSAVQIESCTYEAVPMALTNSNPQYTLTRYNIIFNYSVLELSNITINNNLNGQGLTNCMGRYFIVGYRSVVNCYGNFTLVNNPRVSVFCEPSQGMHYYQHGGFQWVGNFGTRLGTTGRENAFGAENYRPEFPSNYLVKDDGPFNQSYVRSAVPSNCFKSAYAQAHRTGVFNTYGEW